MAKVKVVENGSYGPRVQRMWNFGTPSSDTWVSQERPMWKFIRINDNADPGAFKNCFAPQVSKFVLTPSVLYDGPRLPYKVRRKDGRMVWARAPITIMRYKRVVVPSPRAKGLDLPPNYLDFHEVLMNVDDAKESDAVSGVHPLSGYSYAFVGNLWGTFPTFNGQYADGGLDEILSTHPPYGDRFSATVEDLDLTVLHRLYSKVAEKDVNVALLLAERRETCALIAQLTGKLVKVYRDMRRGRFASALRSLTPLNSGEIADARLALVYGVEPLLSDLNGMIKAVTTPAADYYDFNVSASRKVELNLREYEKSDFPLFLKHKHTTSAYVTVKRKVRVRVSSPKLRQGLDLGFANPVLLAYELIPFSMVLDWLLPVGQWLENQDAFVGLEVVSSSRTVVIRRQDTLERDFTGSSTSGWTQTGPKKSWTAKFFQVTREINAPIPELPKPAFEDPVSVTHIFNAIALILKLQKK